ncbi:glycosyltransferase family 9 protein [Candidatus Finniella inopinata]|uniref:Lipopolysaccharide heptosyltransferase family protein n=1 Tax=Candidatus Finniella inopinata TaxID=1696036 RepID=A0A4Q7DPL2_9PROT|nr:glycosyltransferase family 9 protein [Candidatus Finniella inopinata]RZI46946.1 lipopolysaccharide heptosyltransferase family protein [Candidatus Finniella inopinata]
MSKKILIFSHGELIGDGMMKLPFVRLLSHVFPGAHVTWLAGRHPTIFKTALNPLVNAHIHQVVEYPGYGDSYKHLWQKSWQFFLKDQKIDLIIDTEKKVVSALTLKKIPHHKFVSAAYRWRFSNQKPPNPHQKRDLLLDRLLDLLVVSSGRPLDPKVLESVYDTVVPIECQEHARELLKPYLDHKKVVLLAPGAGGRFKCWPLENFINLAKDLESQGFQPVFILGPAEPEWQQQIQSFLPNAFFPLQETNKTSPYLTIALGQLAAVNVANDGGVGHILASSNQPTISMWGPTEAAKSTPNGRQVVVVKAQDFGGNQMVDIPVTAIYEKVISLAKKNCWN